MKGLSTMSNEPNVAVELMPSVGKVGSNFILLNLFVKELEDGAYKVEQLDNCTDINIINIDGVSKIYNGNKIAIRNVNLKIPRNRITALMGPSGCGKSTLLKILVGSLKCSYGKVEIFGLCISDNFEQIKAKVGYVPQDDTVHLDLTVKESLFYAAKLRLPNLSKSALNEKVKNILESLGIDDLKNSLNKSLSGGQRKRVCIALELLSEPKVLFLDEPTSPLDPQSISDFMKVLRDLVKMGTTVILVTHKPEDLAFVDNVVFLNSKGEVVYSGNAEGVLESFKVNSLPEIYTNLSSVKESNDIEGIITENRFSIKNSILAKANFSVLVHQFRWLLARDLRIRINSKNSNLLLVAQAPIIACLIAFVFQEVDLSVLFMINITAIWLGVNNACREIVKEKSILSREFATNLRIQPYLISKLSSLSILAFFQSVLFTSVLYVLYQKSEVPLTNALEQSAWFWAISVFSSSIGLLISTVMNSTEKVMALVPLVLIPQIILGGVITKISNYSVEFLSYFTFSRWGTTGSAFIQTEVRKQIIIEGQDEMVQPIKLIVNQFHTSFTSSFPSGEVEFSVNLVSSLTLFLVIYFFTSYFTFENNRIK